MSQSNAFFSRFVDSPEFTIAFVSALLLAGLGPVLALSCIDHLSNGHLVVGCTVGSVAVIVSGVSLWKFTTALRRAHQKYG